MNFGAGHAALASVREEELAAVRQRLRRDPSLRFVARDADPDRIGELAALGQWAGRSFRADVVDARKLLIAMTFARRVRREIGAIQLSRILDEKRKRGDFVTREKRILWVAFLR